MKILKLTLKNFSAVKNAMGFNELTIDFSKTQNKICLLIGPNGCGKTTILSMLHPFADLGNLDVRNGNSLILENKEGYKEIQIRRNNDIYTIKHYYTPHKDKNHSVKSYIMKNDVELNVNGNVTSFKEYVREELQIESDYLKLIRLGSNVTSLIDLSATERKNFMSKILDDIGVFLERYKAVNNKLRQLDEMISHTVDKINRIGILDKEEYIREIESLRSYIENLEKEYLQENNKLTLYKNTIEEIEDHENLRDNLSSITKKYTKMLGILERKNQIESFEVEFYDKKIRELENLINANNNEYGSNTAIIQNSLQYLNTLTEQLRTYQVQMIKENESEKELERMEDNLKKLRLRMREYEDNLGEFSVPYSKKEFEDFLLFLKNTQQILRRTYEFGKPPIQRVVELMKNKKNVINYINSHLIDLDESRDDRTPLFLSTIASRFMFGKEDIVIECKDECAAKTLFMQIQNLLRDSNVEDKNEDSSFYHDMEFVYNNLISIVPRFTEYKDIISVLPDDIKKDFMLENIYTHIGNLEPIFNEKKFNELLSMITEYDNYLKLKETYEVEELTLKKFAGLSTNSYIKTQLETTEEYVNDTKDKITKLKERNLLIQEENDEYKKTLEVCLEIKETIEHFQEIKSLYERYTKEYEIYKETREKIANTEIQITRLKLNIDNSNAQLQKKIVDLSQYESLSKELTKMNSVYDDMTYVKESLSSKQGIPLRFIGNYLNNTEDITNELLDIAYDGRIFIDKFDISATEFSIPFYNKGVKLADVKYASQGELSFLSIALSFALSSQALSKYNIMLLDEVDGPLDIRNREKFIKILENQIDRIKSEQNFLITHNAMFSSYPVDIIDLSFTNNPDAYPLATYIEIQTA